MATFDVNRLPKGYGKESVAGRVKDNTIYIGVVKANEDIQRMGRVAVWIPEIGGDPNNENSWFIMSYASPFAGVTPPNKLVEDSKKAEEAQSSYGFWMNPPDLENQVLCCFVNGDTSQGFWFACVYQQNMNHMVPGIAQGKPAEDGEYCDAQPPVVEYNKWSKENPTDPKRPVFTPLAEGLSQQGLLKDNDRGSTTSSARREAPSKVFGWVTPRGNQVYVDDNPDNEFIRMRTRSGAQVLVNETTGFVYINSKNGDSWVEISDKGVDVYSRGAVSLRSEGSLNLHADGSLNIEADGNLNLRAGGNLTIQSAHHSSWAGNGNLALQFGGTASASGAQMILASGGNITMGASGNITQSSSGNNIRSAGTIYDNAGPSAPAANALKAEVEKPRELPEVNGEAPCYQQDTRKTIVRRMPTHEPYKGHATKDSSGTSDASDSTKDTTLNSDEFASPEDANSVTNSSVVPEGGEAKDDKEVAASELDWMVTCMIDEAGNQKDEGKAAVAQVIKNRIASKQASDGTIKGTVLWPNQFSGFYYDTVGGKYQKVATTRAQAETRGIAKMKKYKQNTKQWENCQTIAKAVMGGSFAGGDVFGKLRANKRATMYLNESATRSLGSGNLPSWASVSKKIGVIQDHAFYYA